MCTVTFIARKRGYLLAMNRDEKRTRAIGLPPKPRTIGHHRVICPSEPGGGTWIALNDSGVTLALINWYSVPGRVKDGAVSRGEIIPGLASAESGEAVASGLAALPLSHINPFRLIGAFQETREVIEWRWDLKQLTQKDHRWRNQQWISSGFDEPAAQKIRGRTFRRFLSQTSAGTPDWLRRLHRSHLPSRGPFSTCMHRDDAVTVSFTEISVSQTRGALRHNRGAPCAAAEPSIHQFSLLHSSGLCRLPKHAGAQDPSREALLRQTRRID
jgi:hypothetical protein